MIWIILFVISVIFMILGFINDWEEEIIAITIILNVIFIIVFVCAIFIGVNDKGLINLQKINIDNRINNYKYLLNSYKP